MHWVMYMINFFAESGAYIKLVEMPPYLAESKISIAEKHGVGVFFHHTFSVK